MKRFLHIFLALIISTGILFHFYQNVLLQPNSYLFAHEGDGLTNYYTFAYHVENGESMAEFKGMNYPFGESILYTDAQPILAVALQFLEKKGFRVGQYSVGILNMLMLLSLLIGVVFLYMILELYGLNEISSALGAISIAFLSSQVLLWQFGHYALSYVCFFPLSWYLYMMYQRNPGKIRFTIYIMLNTIFWFYINTYLGMIVLSFTFLSQVAMYIGNLRKKFFDLNWYVEVFLQSVFPAILVFAGITLFDRHPGRIDLPYQDYLSASFYTIFLPNHSWISDVLAHFIDLSQHEHMPWSGLGAYIGLSTILAIVLGLVLLTKNLVKEGVEGFISFLPKGAWPTLMASLFLLAFATGFPFGFALSEMLPTSLKEFASMGRFAWVFYYIITTLGLYFIWKLKVSTVLRTTLISLSCLLMLSEAYAYHKLISGKIQSKENVFLKKNESILPIHAYNWLKTSKYQAILPLPFYHGHHSLHNYNGSDKSIELSEVLSLHTGLPMMSTATARPSVYESQRIAEVFLPDYYPKAIKEYLNDENILVTYTGEDLNEFEEHLLKKARFMFRSGDNQFYTLRMDELFNYNGNKELAEFKSHEDSLILDKSSAWYTIDTLKAGSIVYRHFDEQKSTHVFRGKGALQLKKSELNTVFESKSGELKADVAYELSYYYFNESYNEGNTSVWLEIVNGEKTVNEIRTDPQKSFVYNADWAFNKINFILEDSTNTVRLICKGSNLYADSVYIDELLIRPAGVNGYHHIFSDIVIRNNENVPRF